MKEPNEDFQSSQEIGRIYYSLTDKEILCSFFLDSLLRSVSAAEGFLYLAGRENKIWLEARTDSSKQPPEGLEAKAEAHLQNGKPAIEENFLFLPLIARNSAIGIACFSSLNQTFSSNNLDFGFALASQMAGALKNILLFEENLKMERLSAIGQTIGMVMHEIKNIMQIARLSNDLITMGIAEKQEKLLQTGLKEMAKALREMDGFVWDMLSLTKGEDFKPEKINLSSILDELRQDFSRKVEDQKKRLDFQVEENFPEVDGESRSIYRTLFNLIKNALEACFNKGSFVRVTVKSAEDGYYDIFVEDDGDGMSPEVQAKIFSAFYSTKGSAGTGLGLLIIQQTVRKHKGEISVASELGKGTRFTLKLPKDLN